MKRTPEKHGENGEADVFGLPCHATKMKYLNSNLDSLESFGSRASQYFTILLQSRLDTFLRKIYLYEYLVSFSSPLAKTSSQPAP